jgi:hypothetical protein
MNAMGQLQDTVLQRLGKLLHSLDKDITHRQLPRRWLELIHRLDERLREQDRQLELERNAPESPRKV